MYLVALDEASFKEYSKKIGVKFEDVKDTGILCDEYNEYDKETGAVELKRLYKYEKGDTIVGEYNKEELKIKVGDVSKIKPYGLEREFSMMVDILLLIKMNLKILIFQTM